MNYFVMSEEVGSSLKVVASQIDATFFNFFRSLGYSIWQFCYNVEDTIFESFSQFMKQNPLKSALGTNLYNIFFAVGVGLLIVISSLLIIYNLVSNKPVENKNVLLQLVLSFCLLAITPTMIKQMNNITLNVSTKAVSSIDGLEGKDKLYKSFMYDMEKSVKENKMISVKDERIDKLNINKLSDQDVISQKPTDLVKDKSSDKYVYNTEDIKKGKPAFIGVMQAYKYHVDWFPLLLTTILVVGVEFRLLIQIIKTSITCLFNSYLSPIYQAVSKDGLKGIEFLADYKNDMLYIFLSVMSIWFFKEAVNEIVVIDNLILKLGCLFALAFATLRLANDTISKVSGGSWNDKGASSTGKLASALTGGAIAMDGKKGAAKVKESLPVVESAIKTTGQKGIKTAAGVNRVAKYGATKAMNSPVGQSMKENAKTGASMMKNSALKNDKVKSGYDGLQSAKKSIKESPTLNSAKNKASNVKSGVQTKASNIKSEAKKIGEVYSGQRDTKGNAKSTLSASNLNSNTSNNQKTRTQTQTQSQSQRSYNNTSKPQNKNNFNKPQNTNLNRVSNNEKK